MKKKYKIVIVGAGPTGLGAAHRLKELGENDFHIFERRDYVGGLATTFKDKNGFYWDIGGHVQFSHYSYFDSLMNSLLPNQWLTHERESWVWIRNRFVPYPFQYNIHRLPKALREECLQGLIKVGNAKQQLPAKNFEAWTRQIFGSGICKHFLHPYNFKVWAHPLKLMNASWVGERVAVVDVNKVKENIRYNRDHLSWGPNSLFRFPKKGGTGAIWNQLGKKVGPLNISLNHELKSINTSKKRIRFTNNLEVEYDHLVSTMPLDQLIEKSDLAKKLQSHAKQLLHSTTYIVGVGLQGKPKPELSTKCWMYFPEENCPFYRVTLFSKYSPYNVPDALHNWSLMTEVAGSSYKFVDESKIQEEVIRGLKNTHLISNTDKIISIWYHKENYGYPTPSVGRDTALSSIQPVLMDQQVYSRGRFGMWKYEVSNQDHSLMQGVEVADFIVRQKPEITAWHPNIVNSKRK